MLAGPVQSVTVGVGIDPVTVLDIHTATTGVAVMTNPSRAVLAIKAVKDHAEYSHPGHRTANHVWPGLGADARRQRRMVGVLTVRAAAVPR